MSSSARSSRRQTSAACPGWSGERRSVGVRARLGEQSAVGEAPDANAVMAGLLAHLDGCAEGADSYRLAGTRARAEEPTAAG
ncbi:hypothetical protein ACFU8Q_40900 [Streptomyces sp. NPDC057543]|uniref:hypothetical protein n=1 Tax=Streptomyces sp. NPDC057543 TaxID=3346163 RepID=UPI0036A8F809